MEKTNRCYYKSKQKNRGFNQKNDHKSIYKEVFDKLVKERFDKIIELNNEINQNDLVYYLKDNVRRRFDDFNNGIKLFWKNKIWWNETWKT